MSFSCKSYLQKRAHDFGDIITLQVHTDTYGVTSRISFLKLGLLYQDEDKFSFGFQNANLGQVQSQEFQIIFLGSENFKGIKDPHDPKLEKEFQNEVQNQIPNQIPERYIKYWQKIQKALQQNQELERRKKLYQAHFPWGTRNPHRRSNFFLKEKGSFSNPEIFGDVRFTFGLYGGITFGLHVFELFDFLFGIFGLDLLKDD
ncbi:MAG: hypothetical protein NZ853_06610 [Leptospiraceae bacterium]|nr:hypothetical protein [Leptospiraceae bacterium]MDW7975895.1 hypothetical protein [Leptospiraceae bacterium]